ncbi:unnamed protein product [Ostreobium quekettii]|uniref:Uncharacterized protein n=1 Tax=Ostreobium quekettii TaxID=121088 RepID=A0A8S1JD27_9CHLO|nr:unnamed protein product [Ostreobium quekettii]
MGLGVAAAGVLALGQALELLWPAAKARTAGLGQSVQKLQRDTKAAVEDVQAICADVKNRTGAIEETFKGVERDVQALAGRLERILSDQEPRKESDRLCEPIQMSLLPSLAPQQEHGELDSVEVPDADLFDK